MFFLLSREQDHRFPHHFQLGSLYLNTDEGWKISRQRQETAVFKGYADNFDLSDRVHDISDLKEPGNFCIFSYDSSEDVIKVKTNRWRGFLIWKEFQTDTYVSNLVKGAYTFWNDSSIEIKPDLDVIEKKIDIIGEVDIAEITNIDTEICNLHDRLNSSVENFLKNNTLPLKVFLSGGVDSMLVYSYVKQHTDNYELVDCEHSDWDYFFCQWQRLIKQQFWGYKQIHHWRTPCVLTSGAPGDEFMLRSPTTADLWLRYHGSSIPELMQSYNDSGYSHKKYFSKYQHLFDENANSIETKNSLTLPKKQFFRYLANIVVNDCQHWHFGNTLTFTPLRDLEMFNWFLRLPLDLGSKQISNSEVSRRLIALNDRELLNYLSPIKNTDENLSKVWRLVLQ